MGKKVLVRRPTFLFFSLVQPLVWFLLFTQAFSAVANIPGFQEITGTVVIPDLFQRGGRRSDGGDLSVAVRDRYGGRSRERLSG